LSHFHLVETTDVPGLLHGNDMWATKRMFREQVVGWSQKRGLAARSSVQDLYGEGFQAFLLDRLLHHSTVGDGWKERCYSSDMNALEDMVGFFFFFFFSFVSKARGERELFCWIICEPARERRVCWIWCRNRDLFPCWNNECHRALDFYGHDMDT